MNNDYISPFVLFLWSLFGITVVAGAWLWIWVAAQIATRL